MALKCLYWCSYLFYLFLSNTDNEVLAFNSRPINHKPNAFFSSNSHYMILKRPPSGTSMSQKFPQRDSSTITITPVLQSMLVLNSMASQQETYKGQPGLSWKKSFISQPRSGSSSSSLLCRHSTISPQSAMSTMISIRGGGGHLGQKLAQSLRGSGLSDSAILALISAMPVVELRGGIPVGVWLGLPKSQIFLLAVIGNMIPVPIILLALNRVLQIPFLRKTFVGKLLERVEHKAERFKAEGGAAKALALFVGIPLPGTGAWTGAAIAAVLKLNFYESLLSIFAGVLGAAVIMLALTSTGKIGGSITASILLAIFLLGNRRKSE